MKTFRNILCLLIIGFLFGCSGDSTKSGPNNTSTVIGSETSADGKIKLQKLEGSEIVISNASSDQQNPHVIYLPDKNLWFSVYEDWSNSLATGADIKGKFVDSNGNICGSELTITNASGNQTIPRAAYRDGATQSVSANTNDRIMVVWQDTRSTTNVSGFIYYRTVDVSSLDANCSNPSLGTETAITLEDDNPTTSGTQSKTTSRTSPKITYDSLNDRFFVAWVTSKSSGKTVSYIPFKSNGIIIGWVTGDTQFVGYSAIKGDLTGYTTNPTIIKQVYEDGSDYIRALLVSSTGTAYKEDRTYEFFDQVTNVDIACDSTTQECFVVWEGIKGTISITNTCADDADESPTNGYCDSNDTVLPTAATDYDTGIKGIYGLFEKNLNVTYTSSLGISISTADTYYPAVAFDPITKKFLVAWEDLRDGSNTKIYGQLVYSGSGLYNTNFLISYQDTDGDGSQDSNIANSKQTKPFISYDSVNQRYFVIWQDGRNGSVSLENLDIYGQYVDAEGSLRGSNYSISTARANQYNPTIAYNSQNNQFLAVWKDARNYTTTASDIYGQRFSLGQSQLTLLNADNTSFSPPLIDFGTVNTGYTATSSFKVKNTGDANLKIDCLTPPTMPINATSNPFAHVALPSNLQTCDCVNGNGNPDYTVTGCNYLELVPSSEQSFSITFSTTTEGTFISSFDIKSDAENKTINLQGTGALLDMTISPSPLDFGNTTTGSTVNKTLTIKNNGTVSYQITNISGDINAVIDGFYSDLSSIDFPYTLDPGKSLTLTIEFNPLEVKGYSGTMYIQTSISGFSKTVSLTGTGTGTPVLSTSDAQVDFGSVNVNSTSEKTLTLSNTGDATLTISSFTFTGSAFRFSTQPNLPIKIAPEGSYGIKIKFSPTDTIYYNETLTVQSDGGNVDVGIVGQGVSTGGGTGGGAGGGGSISSSGGGCSIGGHQNAPTAIADLAVMLMPLLFIAIMRRRR